VDGVRGRQLVVGDQPILSRPTLGAAVRRTLVEEVAVEEAVVAEEVAVDLVLIVEMRAICRGNALNLALAVAEEEVPAVEGPEPALSAERRAICPGNVRKAEVIAVSTAKKKDICLGSARSRGPKEVAVGAEEMEIEAEIVLVVLRECPPSGATVTPSLSPNLLLMSTGISCDFCIFQMLFSFVLFYF